MKLQRFTPAPALVLAAASALALAGCTAEMEEDDFVSDAPQATVLGGPTDCIETSRIDSTRVYDDRTIDFEMLGDTVYRNTLPYECSQLGFEERFAYETTIGRLCSIDTITVLYGDGQRGATCALGEFVPVDVVGD